MSWSTLRSSARQGRCKAVSDSWSRVTTWPFARASASSAAYSAAVNAIRSPSRPCTVRRAESMRMPPSDNAVGFRSDGRSLLRPAIDSPDARDQLAHVRRLGDIVIRAQFEANDAIRFIAGAGDHDNTAIPLIHQPLDQDDPVGVRQFQVDEHDVGPEAGFRCHRTRPRGCPMGLHARTFDRSTERRADSLIVFDQHDAQHLQCARSGRRSRPP